MTHNSVSTLSHIRAAVEVAPSQSLVDFLKIAKKHLGNEEFENINPLMDPRIYSLNSLRITLFERRAKAGQDASDLLNKLHVIMARDKVTTAERKQIRPGVFKHETKTVPNSLHLDLNDIRTMHVPDGNIVVRADSVIDSTAEDYVGSGIQLALLLSDGDGQKALTAQSQHLDAVAMHINAGKRLARPSEQGSSLHVPFMVAPFDSTSQRDDFIATLNEEMPVFEIAVGPIKWDLST